MKIQSGIVEVGEPIMTLNFPNPSRSFDEKRNAVGFVGYVGVFEIRFFVEADALRATWRKGGKCPKRTAFRLSTDYAPTFMKRRAHGLFSQAPQLLHALRCRPAVGGPPPPTAKQRMPATSAGMTERVGLPDRLSA